MKMMIPEHIKNLMPTMRRIDPDSDDADLTLELSPEQTQKRLQRQLRHDKRKSVIKRNCEIVHVKNLTKKVRSKELKRQLRRRIDKLENDIRQEQRFL